MLMKQEMMRSAGNIGLPSDAIKMAPDDEDAVDLVGMLFDVLFDERDFEAQARTLISRCVVPFVKAAVIDRRLFQYKTHPARRLLNSLAEAVEGNKGEGPQERELLGKAANEYFDLLTKAWKKKEGAFDDRALAHYRASFTDPLRIHAGCEDYRAGQSTDVAIDDADRKAGKKITCPMLALWGATGLPSGNSPLEVWKQWATDVRGQAIECGHFLPEENPQATAKALLDFF